MGMKTKFSQYTPRKAEETLINPKVSTSTRKITLEEICLESDVIHVMRKDTMLENVLEKKCLSQEEGKQEKISFSCCRG